MEYAFEPGDIVTAVNRSSKPLEWRFNGRVFMLKANEERPMNLTYVLYGVRRHPRMGTYDPTFENQHESLIGIKEMADQYPVTPLEQSDCPEAIDRSKLPEDRQNVERLKIGWGSEETTAAGRNPIPVDAGFAGAMADK